MRYSLRITESDVQLPRNYFKRDPPSRFEKATKRNFGVLAIVEAVEAFARGHSLNVCSLFVGLYDLFTSTTTRPRTPPFKIFGASSSKSLSPASLTVLSSLSS